MAINPNNGVLDIVNGVLKVSSIDIKQAGGFTTAINTIARNDVLLFDDQKATTTFTPTSAGGYMSSTGVTRDTTEGAGYLELSTASDGGWVYWPLQLPNSWHAEFDMHVTATGGVLTFSLFNTSTPNHTDYTANDGGYKIVFDNTQNQIDIYWEGSIHKTVSASLRSSEWQHVNINYFQGHISVSLAGKVVLTHEFTQNYQEFDSRYVGFSATAGVSHKIRHLRVHNSDKWLYTKTSNASDITYVSGNVGIGTLSPTQLLDVHGNVHIAKDLTVNGNLTVSGTTTFIDTTNMAVEDPIIELARGNASDTVDAGLIITRPTSNVAIAYRGDEGELALGYTQSGASGTDVVPVADGGLDVRVYGNLFANNLTTTANVEASYLKGDGSEITAVTLSQVVGYGNTTSNTLQLTNTDVGLVATGNVEANYFVGDGSKLTGLVTTLEDVANNGNTISNVVQFTNATTAFVTSSNVGVGTTTPTADLHVVGYQYVNNPPAQSASFDHSDAPLTLTHATPTSTTTLNDPKPVLHLTRDGTASETYGARASFNLSRYENSGTASRSRLDVALTDGTYAESTVMTLRADGKVGVGTTAPGYMLDVHGTANVGALTATSISGPLTGNASTATKLQTARTIGGVSFDGSANIDLPGVNTSGNQNTTGSAATLTTPRAINGVNFDGSAAITITAGTSQTLTRGDYLTGSNFDGTAATTWAVDATTTNTASKVVARDASGDILCRLVRPDYTDQTTISGAMAYRVSTTDNYIRFCSDKGAIRTFLELDKVKQINGYTEVNINSPDGVSGTWTTANSTAAWGNPKFNITYNNTRWNDAPGHVQYNIPTGMKSAYISQLNWSSGGYVDVHGVQEDGGLVFLRRINTRQAVENTDEGDPTQHDGATVTFAGSGLEYYTAIRLTNKVGRFHMTGLAFTPNPNEGTEGTGMVHSGQISDLGSGIPTPTGTGASGTWGISITGDADTVDSLHASSFFRSDASNGVNVRFTAGDGTGVRFWDDDNYKIWMSSATNATWGGRLSSNSDYNMYFKMNGGTNRGFCFMNSTTVRAHITGGGDMYLNGGWFRTYGSTGWYNETHGGGWYMTDSTWVRAYNSKSIYGTGEIHVHNGDSGNAILSAYGDSQGTGRLYVGQSSTYGGGIEYNGDNTPASTGAGADYIALYRVDNGTYNWTARNYYNNNDWAFRGQVYAEGAFYTDANRSVIRGAYPTLYFRDTEANQASAMIHCNANGLYILRGSSDSETWTQVNNQWPWIFNLSNNDSTCGGNLYINGGNMIFGDSRGLRTISGDYGTVQTTGEGVNGWEGYSIDGRYVFMSADNNSCGIYNDVDNRWMIYGDRNYIDLRFQGTTKLQTTSTGVTVNGTVTANGFSGTATNSTNLDGVGSGSYLRSDTNTTMWGGSAISFQATNSPGLKFQNASWYTSLWIGGWSSDNSNDISRIRNSSGNLHIDSAANGSLYLNWYTSGSIEINSTVNSSGYINANNGATIRRLVPYSYSYAAGYNTAAIEVREYGLECAAGGTEWARAPRIGFHWCGRVASQILCESNGRISVVNNPGNAYEAFGCSSLYSSYRIGVQTSNPFCPLHVFGTGGDLASGGWRYLSVGGSGSGSGDQWGAVCASFEGGIIRTTDAFLAHNGYLASSDHRIKKEILDINDASALEKLRLIEPKTYKYKDEQKMGADVVYGFIAQQIQEVLPYATNTVVDYIPSICEMANVSQSNVITFINFNTSTISSNVTTIQVHPRKGPSKDVTISEIINEHSIRVNEDLTEMLQEGDARLFVYGELVSDFVTIKKDAIWTIATAALQEVDRQQQADKVRIAELEAQLASVLARLNALENPPS